MSVVQGCWGCSASVGFPSPQWPSWAVMDYLVLVDGADLGQKQ
jgi:hypothetical protein